MAIQFDVDLIQWQWRFDGGDGGDSMAMTQVILMAMTQVVSMAMPQVVSMAVFCNNSKQF